MRGFENRPKVAPPLTHPTAKLTPEWMARWIKDPKAFRPSTRMPRFFGLRNNQGPGDVEREDAEVVGIVAYLTEKAEKRSYPSLPGRGEPERGRKLVKSIGCMGCHAIERDEVQAEVLQARNSGQKADPIAWERRFGPDLSRIGSKARPEWIYQWILNPRQYNPETRMPSLRLTSQEALDITAYLTTLTDDTPDDRRVGAVLPQPTACSGMPHFGFRADQPPAVTLLRQGLTKERRRPETLRRLSARDEAVEAGRRLVRDYNCQGCHILDGRGGSIRESIAKNLQATGMSEEEATSSAASFAPPLLEGEGDKVQPDWLLAFLKGPNSI